jgi:phosphate transport system substrate-binding protein
VEIGRRFRKAIVLAGLAGVLPTAAFADTMLTAAGSTALLPLVKQSAVEYEAMHPDIKISVSGGGSFVGIDQTAAGTIDLGDSDVIAPGSAGLTDHKVAVVGFGIIVNPSADVSNLSPGQIRDIFAGRVYDWKQVGGADQAIVVINRTTSSGTRNVFNTTVMGVSKIAEGGLTVDSSGSVVTTVATTPGSISYVALGYTKDKPVTVVKVNGVAPTADTIRTGKYPIWSYEHIFTKGSGNAAAEAFIKYIENNHNAIDSLGFISVSSMKVHELNR